MSVKKSIVVHDYNPAWASEFETLKAVFVEHVGDDIVDIEHVGSTSIPGLKAKPVIDVDIVVSSTKKLQRVIGKLEKLGYRHVGDLGITGREAFKRRDDKTPDTEAQRVWMKHNLYVCIQGSIGLANHLKFRDYLKAHPVKIKEYSALKQGLAEQFPNDIDAYIDGKTDFIVEILRRSGMSEHHADLIDGENRLKN